VAEAQHRLTTIVVAEPGGFPHLVGIGKESTSAMRHDIEVRDGARPMGAIRVPPEMVGPGRSADKRDLQGPVRAGAGGRDPRVDE